MVSQMILPATWIPPVSSNDGKSPAARWSMLIPRHALGRALVDHRLIELHCHISDPGPRVTLGSASCLFARPHKRGAISRNGLDHDRQLGGVLGFFQQESISAAGNDLGDSCPPAHDRRNPAGHRLQHWHAERFLLAWQDAKVGSPIEIGHVTSRSQEPDPASQCCINGSLVGGLAAAAYEDQARVEVGLRVPKIGESRDELLYTFALPIEPDEYEDRGGFVDAQLPAHEGATSCVGEELAQIHTVWDDRQPPRADVVESDYIRCERCRYTNYMPGAPAGDVSLEKCDHPIRRNAVPTTCRGEAPIAGLLGHVDLCSNCPRAHVERGDRRMQNVGAGGVDDVVFLFSSSRRHIANKRIGCEERKVTQEDGPSQHRYVAPPGLWKDRWIPGRSEKRERMPPCLQLSRQFRHAP